MAGLKTGLSVLLTAVGVVLVSSCGSSAANPSETPTEPQYRVLDRFEWNSRPVEVVCRHNDMYVLSYSYTGVNVQRIDNHKECE